ncbi:MAG: Gfo/Idh/MocA family oxidoreductase [Tunicatimonas sp.]|uniref:Gfo/Idh/MocA family protein n=1 Tax=Tunicatimonas sp. TaxID=1940096 RepID=UPI003C74CDA3
MSNELSFAVIGCGFWAQYQIAAWQELAGVKLVAVCDQSDERAQQTAKKFGVSNYYTDAKNMLEQESLDFVDIITTIETHQKFTQLAARHQLPAICQKPFAPDLDTARQMIMAHRAAGVPLFVHENFRWQAPIRRVKSILDSGEIGEAFKGRVTFTSAFPVFDNQPNLAELDKFILADVGSHTLDMVRFLFGEAVNLRCLTQRVNPNIAGEDVANVLLEMESGVHCYAEMSYASVLEKEVFPHTLLLVEGSKGSVRLDHNYRITVTNREGSYRKVATPKKYDWANPDYALVHSSMVDINKNFLTALQNGTKPETTAADNYRTLQLVYECYRSAKMKQVITLEEPIFS